jgi:transcription elongation GreA/GreB family factor
MDKARLRQAIVERLESDLAVLISAANASKSEATDADSKAEGKFDMRGQSAAYLAGGQAKLATELGEAIAAYQFMPLPVIPPGGAVRIGTLVALESRTGKTYYFIGPARGGIELNSAGVPVTVISAVSPLGRQLLGRQLGDNIPPGATRGADTQTVVEIL